MSVTTQDVIQQQVAASTATLQAQQVPSKERVKKGDNNDNGDAMGTLIVALMELVNTFTGTMQAFQERFQQLSDIEQQLAAEIKKKMSQEDLLKYKAQIQDVQNEQTLSSTAIQTASSNDSTLMTMLGSTVKIFGNTLLGIAQSMSS